jgi:hypothetical protein
MTSYLRFPDLKARGIVNNWAQLKNLVGQYGFPAGQLLSPNVRAWRADRVQAWLDSRPAAKKPVPRSPGRPRKAEHTDTA